MLLEDMANEIVSFTSELVGGRTINVMNTDGIIVASTEKHRIGSFHQGALEAVRTGKPVAIRADQLAQYPGAKQGYNMPLRVNGAVIGVVGIFGEGMGPAHAQGRMNTMVGLIYDSLATNNQGRASAAALILFAIILLVTMINLYVSKKRVHY